MTVYTANKEIMDYYFSKFRSHFSLHGDRVRPRRPEEFQCNSPVPVDWQQREFYDYIASDPHFVNDGGRAIFVISPNPYLYYSLHFRIFPLIESSNIRNPQAYLDAIHADPGGSPADAIAYRGDKIVISSKFGSKLFYFDEINEWTAEFVSSEMRPFELL